MPQKLLRIRTGEIPGWKQLDNSEAQTTKQAQVSHARAHSLTPWSLNVARDSSFPLRATMDLRRSARILIFPSLFSRRPENFISHKHYSPPV